MKKKVRIDEDLIVMTLLIGRCTKNPIKFISISLGDGLMHQSSFFFLGCLVQLNNVDGENEKKKRTKAIILFSLRRILVQNPNSHVELVLPVLLFEPSGRFQNLFFFFGDDGRRKPRSKVTLCHVAILFLVYAALHIYVPFTSRLPSHWTAEPQRDNLTLSLH